MLDSDKKALIDNTATILYKIIINGNTENPITEYEVINTTYEDYRYVDTATLVVGQFVARTFSGELTTINKYFEIEDTDIEVQMGIKTDESTNWYSLGNFLITKPTNDDVKDKTSFSSMDYTKKFNQPFNPNLVTFPCPAGVLAEKVCEQCGVELATLDFTNSDFIIAQNPYVENESCRKVMQDIGQLAYSWVRIGWDNRCYIDFDINEEPADKKVDLSLNPQESVVNDLDIEEVDTNTFRMYGTVGKRVSIQYTVNNIPKEIFTRNETYKLHLKIEINKNYIDDYHIPTENLATVSFLDIDNNFNFKFIPTSEMKDNIIENTISFTAGEIISNTDHIDVSISGFPIGTETDTTVILEIYGKGDGIDDYNRINPNNYYDLSTQKTPFGPVNRVVIGIKDVEGENIFIEDKDSINKYGVTELQLYDSNITYTPELRLQAINGAERLFGLTYIPLDVNTTGHPWLLGKEKIEITTLDNIKYVTYPFDRTIEYAGHIKTKLTSKADTKTETEYKNDGTLENQIKKTRVLVDKANQQIELLTSKVVDLSRTVTGMGEIQLDNAYEGTLHYLEIIGDIKLLYPHEDLYPADDVYPIDTYLYIDDTKYHLDLDYLNYLDSHTYDKYIYEDGKQRIERNVGMNPDGSMYPLEETVIEERQDILLQVRSNSRIYMESFNTPQLTCIYLEDNDYTDTFTNNFDIIARINLSPGEALIEATKLATITADKISLKGKNIDLTGDNITINSANLSITEDGSLTCQNANIRGTLTTYNTRTNLPAISIHSTQMDLYNFMDNGEHAGTIGSLISNNRYGCGLWLAKDNNNGFISIGYKINADSISPVISCNKNSPDPPYIKNTVSGTILPQLGNGITVKNGLITDWNLKGCSKAVQMPDGLWLNVENGIITELDII